MTTHTYTIAGDWHENHDRTPFVNQVRADSVDDAIRHTALRLAAYWGFHGPAHKDPANPMPPDAVFASPQQEGDAEAFITLIMADGELVSTPGYQDLADLPQVGP